MLLLIFSGDFLVVIRRRYANSIVDNGKEFVTADKKEEEVPELCESEKLSAMKHKNESILVQMFWRKNASARFISITSR